MPYGLKDIELEKLSKVFAANERIERVVLYGSRAKGNYKPFSDVDITMMGSELTHTDLNRISLAIDDLLLPYQFDISIFHTLKNEALIDHIHRVGITIYERESEWKEYKLGELIKDIAAGPFGSNLKVECFVESGFPIIDGANLKGIKVTDNITKYVTEKKARSLHRAIAKRNDIVVTISGNLGQIAYIPDNSKYFEYLVSQRQFRATFDETKVDVPFLVYYFHTRGGQHKILSFANQVGVPALAQPIKNFREIELELPPIDKQRRIAGVLRSLDDKIDLLRRENATLEAMAESLFRQWFVVEAKEEWEEGKLGDWVVIKRGGSPRPINDYIAPSGYRWLKISDVTNLNSPYIFQTKEYIKESGLQKTVYLRKGSLVLSNSATPGIPKILCVDSCIHDGWLYFPKSSFSKIYLYLLFKYIREDLVNLGNGSIFTNLKTEILKDYKVVKPDAKTLENFDHHVQPIFDKLYSNDIQIQTLIQTRDGLLPRLMGGEIKL